FLDLLKHRLRKIETLLALVGLAAFRTQVRHRLLVIGRQGEPPSGEDFASRLAPSMRRCGGIDRSRVTEEYQRSLEREIFFTKSDSPLESPRVRAESNAS